MKTALKTILLLLLLVLLAEGVYELCFWHHDRMAYSGPLVAQVDRINATGADILYLGESSNHTYGLDDTDTAWISHLLGRHFPEKHVADMTHDASHAEVYYLLLKNLRQDCPIGTVVVTMNLRSFPPGWIYSPLETALQKRMVMLRHAPAAGEPRRPLVQGLRHQDRRASATTRWTTTGSEHPLPGHPSVPRWADSLCTTTTPWQASLCATLPLSSTPSTTHVCTISTALCAWPSNGDGT